MTPLHFLVDECLSPKLADAAISRGIPADHVGRLGLDGKKDWQLVPVIFDGPTSYTFVTNNRIDFLKIHGRQEVHAGLVVIVPNVERPDQLRLFALVLDYLERNSGLDLVNHVLEIYEDGRVTFEALAAA